MLTVRIELHSAITGKKTEIGCLRICNDGTGNAAVGHYVVELMRKGSGTTVQRKGSVRDFPRASTGVWSLVARALAGVGVR